MELSIWLLFTWIITILILWRGIRSYGKIAYFLALFPYVILIGFLIHSLLQNGSMDGLYTFLKPDFNELKFFINLECFFYDKSERVYKNPSFYVFCRKIYLFKRA